MGLAAVGAADALRASILLRAFGEKPAMTVSEMLHRPTIARCVEEIDGGLDVHRWIKLWESDGRKIDEALAVAFYQQALQDAREALTELGNVKPA
jgi:hypothetical protein